MSPDPTCSQTDAARAAYAQWRKAVDEELQGAPFDKKLVSRTFEGVALQPVYTRLEASDLPHADTVPGQAPFVRAIQANGYAEQPWEFAQEISAVRPADFNTALLADLSRGQNSVVLPLDAAARAGQDADAEKAPVGRSGVSISDLSDLLAALKDVELACIPVHIDAGANPFAAGALYAACARKRGTALANLSGSVTGDPLRVLLETGATPASFDSLLDQLAGWTNWAASNAPELKTVGVSAEPVLEGGGNAVQELAYAVAAGAEYVRGLGKRRVALDTLLSRLRFSFSVGPQFFTEVAKFRAFRLLWARVVAGFGMNPDLARSAVHARTARWNKTVLDMHVNMLRVTTEALSAVLGGVNSLHIAPFDEVIGGGDEFSRRVARNVHTLLAEEFRLTSPADPSGGAWYVEKLTDELARKAWALFQEIEKQGGCAASLRSGLIQKQIATSAAEKDDALSKRRMGLVGTNLFPNLKEKILDPRVTDAAVIAARRSEVAARRASIAKPASGNWTALFDAALSAAERGATLGQLSSWVAGDPADKVNALPARRASEGYEALRLASEAFAKRTGARPKVFVAKMGPAAQHKARADFAAGFFAVAGFEMSAKETFETAEAAAAAAVKAGAPIAVLCSTDDTYPTLAPAFAKAVKAAKPDTTVVLAGYPTEHIEAFKAAGFDEFIHIRANVREMLANLLKKIGATI